MRDYRCLGAYSQLYGWELEEICARWGLGGRVDHERHIQEHDRRCDDYAAAGCEEPEFDICIVQDRWNETWDEVLDFNDVAQEVRHAA